jgi:hypothetical protein
MDHIEADGRGLKVGQRMLRDAHGWDYEHGHSQYPASYASDPSPGCTWRPPLSVYSRNGHSADGEMQFSVGHVCCNATGIDLRSVAVRGGSRALRSGHSNEEAEVPHPGGWHDGGHVATSVQSEGSRTTGYDTCTRISQRRCACPFRPLSRRMQRRAARRRLCRGTKPNH